MNIPGECLNRQLPRFFFFNFTLLSRAFIPLRKYEGKIAAAAKVSGLHFLRSVFILSQFDFVFQKGPKPCTFKGSGDHGNIKWNWELIFEISCAYYRSRTNGNGKLIWLGSFLFRHDICFLICQQLAWKRKPVIRLSFLAGRGEAAGNGPYLQGPSHLGLLFQAAMAPMYARKFFL